MAPEGEKDICPIFQNIDPIIAPKKKNNQRLEKKMTSKSKKSCEEVLITTLTLGGKYKE